MICDFEGLDSLWRRATYRLHPDDWHGRKEHLGDALANFPSVRVPASALHEQATTVHAVLWWLLVVILLHHFEIEILRGKTG